MNDASIVVCPHCHSPNRVPNARLGEDGACGKCKQRLFAGAPVELDATNFEKHIGRSELPVVVDFWAPWCGPCRTMAPAFAKAAGELEPEIRLAKVNTEDAGELATRYGIRSIPTLVAFRNGHEVARQSGALDAGSLVRWIRSSVS